jgi:hypothetical protein
VSQSTTTERRDWNWERDGAFEGHYVETREVVVKNGPSAGQAKIVFDFHVGLDDEAVSVWETAVLRSKFAAELRARRKADFELGERITITPAGMKESANGKYRDFAVSFQHQAPKRTAAELLEADGNDDALVDSDPAPEVPAYFGQLSDEDAPAQEEDDDVPF